MAEENIKDIYVYSGTNKFEYDPFRIAGQENCQHNYIQVTLRENELNF